MTDEIISASARTHWQKLQLNAIATVYDIGFYLVLWVGVLCLHFMRLAALNIGFDSEVLEIVHWMETVANISLFGSFFARIVLRAFRGIAAGEQLEE